MLDHHGRRILNEPREPRRPVEVEEVVVGEFLAAELLEASEPEVRAHRGIHRRRLMRVLAVAEWQPLLEFEGHPRRQRQFIGEFGGRRGSQRLRDEACVPGHPPSDHGVVLRGVLEGRGGELPPLRKRRAASGHRRDEGIVLGGACDDAGEGVVLGSRPHEARTTDIDEFDRLGRRAIGLRDHALEVVEVDDHRVEPFDAVLGEHGEVVGPVAAGEDAGEDVGVERLHAAVEHLGKAGDRRHVVHRDAEFGQRRRGAAGAGDADTCGLERRGEPVEARLVEHADKDAADRDDVDGRRRGSRVGRVHGPIRSAARRLKRPLRFSTPKPPGLAHAGGAAGNSTSNTVPGGG